MAISGLDIYKLLPKTNCRKCGFVTCLAFAMQLAKRQTTIDKCPYVSEEAKKTISEASLPPIKLVKIGQQPDVISLGNETVLFRHEDKFYHPTALGIIIEDNLNEKESRNITERIKRIRFERVGQILRPELIGIVHAQKNKEKFLYTLEAVIQDLSDYQLVLMCEDPDILKEALKSIHKKRPLIYGLDKNNFEYLEPLIKEFNLPVVVKAENLDSLSKLVQVLNQKGIEDILLEFNSGNLREKIWYFTQIRRQALRRVNRNLGYPIFTIIDSDMPYTTLMHCATLLCKYASVILTKELDEDIFLSLLVLRQNIYSDPQKPLQIEPKIYPVGQVNSSSPVLVTTNFSLTYYTVLSEVEASKIPSYILSVDTEGMSVLTAWAAEKFTPEKINESLVKFSVKDLVSHRRLIIPGYVAVMSGELEEKSGWEIIVGPKEASGIPSFLKNLFK